ncbi:MAG: isoleucine--tRNA ligase [Alphaproteobacteria bacterium]|nr:isoleucine--tRNA ligase [Alphaproteobacteria bacterium]
MSVDYRDTVFLPKTAFPMRGSLPTREPILLERWKSMDLFRLLREEAAGRPKFILHDGPPYANGHLHIGHALNKILKDVINRSQQMLGKDANYVPGWDCHGLPIEWKIEEQYRAAGKDKDKVPVVEFRRECREFAAKWIDIQRTEFKRLGIEGDWERPYSTMAFDAEAQILREIHKFALNGGLYRGAKPVLWSVVEKTALADAEVEYHDHVSDTVYVRFPIESAQHPALKGTAALIWTTTPWTLPGNRAIAYGPEIAYAVVVPKAVAEGAAARVGERLLMAVPLVASTCAAAGIAQHEVAATLSAADLAGAVARHPLRGKGYDFPVKLLPGAFVTTDQGTGLVHIAPGHGADDFELGQAHGVEVPFTVEEDGRYAPTVPLFAGKAVYKPDGKKGDANAAVIAAIEAAGGLLAKGRLQHSYPHSWRSKAPLIFRNTSQWFISMESTGLRQTALKAIGETRWVPGQGENRIRSMIESRPDWCVSRQRAWGVPIALFVSKRSGEILKDAKVLDRIAEAFEAEGGDAWFSSPPARFLGPGYDPAEWEQVKDIVEVWFESGSTHSFVLEKRNSLAWPASLYLEGSDQHRGWFHSSLLESCGTRGRAPYDAVLTHGFVLDQNGMKMAKSLGNVVAPQEVCSQFGADILRLWVVASDYSEDLRIGPEILKQLSESYRRLRNTLRWLIGALDGFTPAERVPEAGMPELERWVLHRLAELDKQVRQAVEDFDFHAIFRALHEFCAVDLSAFYFDVRKDVLYCASPADPARRACRTVLDHVFSCLTAWLAPILCFTAEEAWLARSLPPGSTEKDNGDFLATADARALGKASVHLRLFPAVPAAWADAALAAKWDKVRRVRRVVTGALEKERAAKRIGSSLQAAPTVHVPAELLAALQDVDMAEACIVSAIALSPAPAPADAFRLEDVADVAVVPGLAAGDKCPRCWRVLPEVGQARRTVSGVDSARARPDLCDRCSDVVASGGAAA